MAALHLTCSTFPADAAGRFVATLLRAEETDLVLALAMRDATATESAMIFKAHAMLHGDAEAADRWMEDYPALLERDRLTVREKALADLVDAVAETCTA